MNKIIIERQIDFDKLPKSFDALTVIEIRSSKMIIISKVPSNSSVRACDHSSVEAYGNSSVTAYSNSSVMACDNSSVMACDNSSVTAYSNSSVTAYSNSSVEACDTSSIKAYSNSSVTAHNNSSVTAHNNSSVMAYGNSSIEAYGNSSVTAYDNSSVVAHGNSSVVAYNNSSIRAYELSCIRNISEYSFVNAFDNVTVYCRAENSNIKYENSVNAINKEDFITPTFEQWLERGIVSADGIKQTLISKKSIGEITIYKTCDFKKEEFYVAQKGDKFAHAKTIKEAINDLRYKISNRDTTKFESWKIEEAKTVDELIEAYRIITGACAEGTKMFCESIKMKGKYKISEIFEITKNRFGHNEFTEFFNKGK